MLPVDPPAKPKAPPPMMPLRALAMWSAARKGDTDSLLSLLRAGDSVNRENSVRFLRPPVLVPRPVAAPPPSPLP